MIIALSLLVCIIGLLMYALSANPKLVRVGEIMFAAGILAFIINAREILQVIGH
jgi:hypothetical protein